MKFTLTIFVFLLTACHFSPAQEASEVEEYDETTYYYWPEDETNYKILYEIVNYEAENFSAQYPVISNLPETHPLNQAVKAYQTRATEWEQEQKVFIADMTAEAAADPDWDFSSPMPWDYSVSWLGGKDHSDLWSLAFEVYEYGGGAHGDHWTDTYNYHLPTQKILGLTDLLDGQDYGPVLDKAVKEAVVVEKQKRWKEWNDAPQAYNPNEDFFLQDLTFDAESLSRWVVTKKGTESGIMFFFPPYDIGAYAEGGYEVFIPKTVFEAWLKEEFKSVF